MNENEVRKYADELLSQMSTEEKAGQLNQASGSQIQEITSDKTDEAIIRGQVGALVWLMDVKEINRLQHLAVEKSRLHIPLLIGFDVIHGYRTVFPVPLAMASSWDPTLEEEVQRIAAQDARAAGIHWTFTPMVDIARDARWGRIVEGAGEDPYLGAAMAQAQVRGFQGETLGPQSVIACAKHFAGYGAAEGGRDYDSSYIPEVLLRNVYFAPFRAAEQAGVGCFMSAYMDLNDVPATGNRWLLNDVLRKDWGFRGFVVSDAFAVKDLVTHGYARDPDDAAYKALSAGLNLDMASGTLVAHVPKLVVEGKITRTELDDAVRPILEAKIRLGLFKHPYVDDTRVDQVLNRESSRILARKVAAHSMVLLRNVDHVLPLSGREKRIAVIGPLADSPRDLEGGWTVEGSFVGGPKSHTVTLLEALRKRIPESEVEVVPGPPLQRTYSSFIDSLAHRTLQPDPTPAEIKQWIEKTTTASRKADVVLAVMGEAANMSAEGASRATLDLPGIQQKMLEAAVASGRPVVLVLVSGRPLDVRWANDHVPAILQAWYPGSEAGNAILDVLFGDVNPGGKLPVSWPRIAGQEPIYYNHNLTHEPEDKPSFASRYWDLSSSPLYPFGYGLSYTTFEFKNVRLSRNRIMPNQRTEVLVDVTNTGTREGDVVAQVYTHQRAGSASRPVRQLKGFKRVTLAPAETQTLNFTLGPAELEFWSPQTRLWAVEPGTFDIWVGNDSTATLHSELEVTK